MKFSTKEKILLALVVSSLSLSLQLYLSNEKLKYGYKQISDIIQNDLESGPLQVFLWNFGLVDLLNNEEVDDAKFLLFHKAKYAYDDIDLANFGQPIDEKIRRFNSAYMDFMGEHCKNNNAGACVQLGKEYMTLNELDKAHEVLMKAAMNDHYDAMFELSRLYRNKDWSNYSQEESEKWLLRTGQ